jgi:hypothetical protein
MEMNKTSAAALGVVTGVTLLATEAETAQAAFITEPEVISIISPSPVSGSTLLNFNQFNPALGTLTGVNFGLVSSNTTTAAIFARNEEASQAAGTTDNFSSFQVQVNSPNLGTLFGPQPGHASAFCTAEGTSNFSCTDAESVNQSFNGNFVVPGGSIGAFVGPGTFNANLLFSSSLETTCGATSECDDLGSSISWSGTLTVQYTFNAAATGVSEPSALLLFGGGIAGLALARRRKEPTTG